MAYVFGLECTVRLLDPPTQSPRLQLDRDFLWAVYDGIWTLWAGLPSAQLPKVTKRGWFKPCEALRPKSVHCRGPEEHINTRILHPDPKA